MSDLKRIKKLVALQKWFCAQFWLACRGSTSTSRCYSLLGQMKIKKLMDG